MPRVVHFEIPADNPGRAVDFYTKVFNWKVNKWEGPMDYWLVSTGKSEEPGIDGAIVNKSDRGEVTDTIDVPSVDDFLAKIEANGGKTIMPKTAVPGVGYMAYFGDTEGNTFGLMQVDETAQ